MINVPDTLKAGGPGFDTIDGNSRKISNVADPVSAQDAATKNYVDTHSSSVPTGTGFRHVTSSSEDGTARAVNLATADVTGTLPTGNQAAQTLGGQASGTTASVTVINATMPANTYPQLGTGCTFFSPDGAAESGKEDSINSTALGSDGNTTVYTTASFATSGDSQIVDLELEMKVDGSNTPANRALWRRTFFGINNGGTVTAADGSTADVNLGDATFIGSSMSTATCVLIPSGTTMIARVARPTGVACHVIGRINYRTRHQAA